MNISSQNHAHCTIQSLVYAHRGRYLQPRRGSTLNGCATNWVLHPSLKQHTKIDNLRVFIIYSLVAGYIQCLLHLEVWLWPNHDTTNVVLWPIRRWRIGKYLHWSGLQMEEAYAKHPRSHTVVREHSQWGSSYILPCVAF